MIQITFTNLDDETQQRLLTHSKKEVERKFGDEMKTYARNNNLKYENLLYTEAMLHLCNIKIVFKF